MHAATDIETRFERVDRFKSLTTHNVMVEQHRVGASSLSVARLDILSCVITGSHISQLIADGVIDYVILIQTSSLISSFLALILPKRHLCLRPLNILRDILSSSVILLLSLLQNYTILSSIIVIDHEILHFLIGCNLRGLLPICCELLFGILLFFVALALVRLLGHHN